MTKPRHSGPSPAAQLGSDKVLESLPCAAAAVAVGESLVGSANTDAQQWLCLEHHGPWPANPLASGSLDPPLEQALAHWRHTIPSLRPQLVRWARPATTTSDKRRVVFADSRARQGGVLWDFGVVSDTALPSLPLSEYKQQAAHEISTPPVAQQLDSPLLLVCTHGKRDRCCAKYGHALWQCLHARYPNQVWQSSHLGGHRFAPCLLMLPSGLMFGQLTVEEAPNFAAQLLAGQLSNLARYRGRAGDPAVVQAAEVALRRQAQLHAIDAVRWTGECHDQGDRTEVVLGLNSGEHVHLQMRCQQSTQLRPSSCGATPTPWQTWLACNEG